MSAKERLLNRAASVIEKTAAAILWKYVDPDGDTFYMEDRRLSTTRSPFSGKSFTAKPVRQSLTDVAKELRSGDAKVKGALWKYVSPDGDTFYCDQRLVGTVKSPISGKTFPAKPEKFTLSEVSKSLKLDQVAPEEGAESGVDAKLLQEMKAMLLAKGYDPEFATTLQEEGMGPTELEERLKDRGQFEMNYPVPQMKQAKVVEAEVKNAGSQEQWDMAAEIIKNREKHPAIKVIKDQYNKILEALEECEEHSKGMQRVGAGHTEDPTFVMTYVAPEIQELAETCQLVAKQLEQRLGRA